MQHYVYVRNSYVLSIWERRRNAVVGVECNAMIAICKNIKANDFSMKSNAISYYWWQNVKVLSVISFRNP